MLFNFLKLWSLLFVACVGFMFLSVGVLVGLSSTFGPGLGILMALVAFAIITGYLAWTNVKDERTFDEMDEK